MKRKILNVNKGIVLLLLLVVTAISISIVDMIKNAALKESARSQANTFITEIASLYTWPKDMPDIDAIEFEKNEKKYYSYFDAGYEKVKPYVYDSSVIKDELRTFAMKSVRSFLLNDVKPEQVTFTPDITKVDLNKGTATVTGSITSKTTTKGGKTFNRSTDFNLHMEYRNDEWIVVGFFPSSESF